MSEISSIQIELPLVALRGLTVMPDMIIHFDLSRDFSKAAVEHAMTETQQIFLVAQKNPEQDTPTGYSNRRRSVSVWYSGIDQTDYQTSQ